MQREIVQPAEFAGAALDELKQWLGISRDNEDQQLQGLLSASHELCEAFTGQVPIETGLEELLPAASGWQTLNSRPVRAITEVQAVSASGTRLALSSSDYEIDIDVNGVGCVKARISPDTRAIAVKARAGISPDWNSQPDALRHGIVRLAAHHYRDRDMEKPASPPTSIAALWRPWRLIRIT